MNATVYDDNPIVSSLTDLIESSENYGFSKEKQKFNDAYANLVDDYCAKHRDVCSFSEEMVLVNEKLGGVKIYDINYAVTCGSEECLNLWTDFDFALEDEKKAKKRFESKHLALAINRMRLCGRCKAGVMIMLFSITTLCLTKHLT